MEKHPEKVSAEEKHVLEMRAQIEQIKYFKKMGWPLPYR